MLTSCGESLGCERLRTTVLANHWNDVVRYRILVRGPRGQNSGLPSDIFCLHRAVGVLLYLFYCSDYATYEQPR